MRIVSENSDADLAKRQAELQLGFELREMAANLLRIVRGAGRPGDLRKQLLKCLQAYEAHGQASGYYPMPEVIARMLDADRPWPPPAGGHDHREDDWSPNLNQAGELYYVQQLYKRKIGKAALQITASRLVVQRVQERRGESDMEAAITGHENARRDLASYWATQRNKSLAAPRTRVNKPKKADRKAAVGTPSKAVAIGSALIDAPRSSLEAKHLPDPFKPPPYEVRQDFALPADFRAEFGVGTVLELVAMLNEAWKVRGRRPLAQGSFPRNAATLGFVVKELRRVR